MLVVLTVSALMWEPACDYLQLRVVAGGTGTSMLIEDVACPVDKLGDMTQDLVDMFQKYGYKDASCFGHALEGNLHLVFSQVSPLAQSVLVI